MANKKLSTSNKVVFSQKEYLVNKSIPRETITTHKWFMDLAKAHSLVLSIRISLVINIICLLSEPSLKTASSKNVIQGLVRLVFKIHRTKT